MIVDVISKLLTIDEHNSSGTIESVDVFNSAFGKRRSRDKDTLIGLSDREGADEVLDILPANRLIRGVAFRLDVNTAQSQNVFSDDTVNPAIIGVLRDFCGSRDSAAVARIESAAL